MKNRTYISRCRECRGFVASGLLIVLCLQGCNSAQSPPLPDFETVAIIPLSKPAASARATTGRNHEKEGFLYGIAAGGGLAIAASATCGPWFLFCATVFSPMAAAVGGTSGLVVGTLINEDLQSVFGEQGVELKPILADLKERRNIPGEILNAVTATILTDRLVDVDQADALISIGPRSIDLVLVNDTELAVRITGELVARWNFQRGANERYRRRSHVHQTSAYPIEHWLANDGANIDQAYSDCVEAVTAGMIADLR